MSDEAIDLVIDFNDVAEKREFLNRVGRATGKWRIRLNRARGGRTYQQQKYYFAAHMTLLLDFLTERGWKGENGKKGTKDELHEMMLSKFARHAQADPISGKIIGYTTRRTRRMTTIEMSDFMENVAQWMAEQFGIVVPPAEAFYVERVEKKRKTKKATSS
jgi:hypothetical protein